MKATITQRLTALEATRPAPATDRAAGLADVIARADAMLAGVPFPPGPPSTNPDVIAHKARLIAAIRGNNEGNN